jgi:hypothetical protein
VDRRRSQQLERDRIGREDVEQIEARQSEALAIYEAAGTAVASGSA